MAAEESHLEEGGQPPPKRYLLDTCSLLWFTNEPDRLSTAANKIWLNRDGFIAVSVISYWEIALKARKGPVQVEDVAGWWQEAVLPYIDVEPVQVRKNMSPICCFFLNFTRIPSIGC